MAKPKLVLEFIFEEHRPFPEDEPDYVETSLVVVKLGKGTTLSNEQRESIVETWGQSDRWHVDIHNDLLEVIDTGRSVSYS